MIGVFLDDERNPEDVTWISYKEKMSWIVVRTMQDFKDVVGNLLKLEDQFAVSFDHDIQDFSNGSELTGYDCIKWMVDECVSSDTKFPIAYFHTQNPIGKKNMEGYYNSGLNFFYGKRS